jgi:hypothetical protein
VRLEDADLISSILGGIVAGGSLLAAGLIYFWDSYRRK